MINGLHLWEVTYEPNQHIGNLLITTRPHSITEVHTKTIRFLRKKFSVKNAWKIKNVKWVGTLDA